MRNKLQTYITILFLMRIFKMIKVTFISILLLFASLNAVASNTVNKDIVSINTISNPPKTSGKIVEVPDIDPMFTGGSHAMNRFIANSLRYPREAAKKDIQGLVVYNFVVELDGTLSNFEIMHKAHPLLDAEALRIIKSMPAWRPAVYKGKKVRASHYVPMYFKLSKNRNASGSQSTALRRKVTPLDPNEEIFTIVDKMPQFPTGEDGLGRFISEYIKYPVRAKEEGIEGRILCSFIVKKDGSVCNLEVVNGLTHELDNEALRVLSMMPKWTPGMNNNKPVNVKCILPIDFTIDEETIANNK